MQANLFWNIGRHRVGCLVADQTAYLRLIMAARVVAIVPGFGDDVLAVS